MTSTRSRLITALLSVAVTLGAVAASAPALSSVAQTTGGGGVDAVSPTRILDTRTTNGGHNAPFNAGETFTLPVLGRGAVPMSGVAAIFGNLTIVATTGGGYVTLYASGSPRPTASNINFNPGQVIANTFLVPLGPDGSISIYSYPAGVNVIIDVQGWVQATTASAVGPSVAFNTGGPTAADSVKAAAILANANRYAMTTWWDGPAQTLLAADLSGDGSTNGDATRRLSMEALSLSTALATGTYPAASGVSAAVATARTVQIINSVASWHVSNRVGGWGDSWQSPMWAGIAGRAAWLIWNQLPAATQQLVASMVQHEADFGVRQQVRYLRKPSGTFISPGNSGAEEASWTISAAQVAIVMLPDHPHVSIWRTEVARFSIAAWARPSDITNATVVNGRAVSAWINGSNVEDNGDVINHNRIASDYSTTLYQNLDLVPLLAMSGKAVPEAARALLAPVYAAFTTNVYPTPTYNAPGGTTYVAGTGQIYYPQDNEWGSGQVLPYALADGLALVCGFDPGTAATYLNLHLDAQLALQSRFSDGHTYLNDAEYNYAGREEHIAQLASQLYLILYLRDQLLVDFTNGVL